MTLLAPLGIAQASLETELASALGAIPGPDLVLQRFGRLVGIAQKAPAPSLGGLATLLGRRDRQGLIEGLGSLQKRLEACCQLGPFLPFVPAARIEARDFAPCLEAAERPLSLALSRHGTRHQWELVLSWTPEGVLARDRAQVAAEAQALGGGRTGMAQAVADALRADRLVRTAELRSVLAPLVLDVTETPAASDLELRLQILVARNGEASIEHALSRLGPRATLGAAADLRGPLPPLAFAAIEVQELDRASIDAAWRRIGLGPEADAATLTRAWRQLAFTHHPDQTMAAQAADRSDAFDQARAAHVLLQGLIGHGALTHGEALDRAGPHLIAPRRPAEDDLEVAA